MERSKIITWEIEEGIGRLTIDNRPQNYLAEPEFLDPDRLRAWTADIGLKGIIVYGAGRHFSAGADLDQLRGMCRDGAGLLSRMKRGREILDYLDSIEVPTIAAIEGACFGAGLELALACHIRVCGAGALFAFPEVNHGLMPGFGGTQRLPDRIGTGRALAMILGGDTVNAEQAAAIGLVEYTAPQRGALDFSLSLMKKMVDGRSPAVIRSVVRSLNNGRAIDRQQALEEETKLFCELAMAVND
jgi:enoyl-CoA hydratase/carnithine racemase